MSVADIGYDFEVKAYVHNKGIISDPMYVEFYVVAADMKAAYDEAEAKLIAMFGNDDDGYDIFAIEELRDEEEEQ